MCDYDNAIFRLATAQETEPEDLNRSKRDWIWSFVKLQAGFTQPPKQKMDLSWKQGKPELFAGLSHFK